LSGDATSATAVGVAPLRRAERCAGDDRTRVDRLDPDALHRGERGQQHSPRIAMARMATVRPEPDGIERQRLGNMGGRVAHAAAPIASGRRL